MPDRFDRRTFVALLAGAAAWPGAARAQQRPLPTIGILGSTTFDSYAARVAAFKAGLKESGFTEGQNVLIEALWADDHYDRLPGMAAELVRKPVALIAAIGNNLPAGVAKRTTTTIPIVFTMGADPVQLGVVASLNRPGGNITGVTVLASELTQKRMQLLHELVPNAKVFGFLHNPDNDNGRSPSGQSPIELAQSAAATWGATFETAATRSVDEFDPALAHLVERRIDALATSADALFISARARLIALTLQHKIPAIFHAAETVRSGGLMSYAGSTIEVHRQAGIYAGRILKGEQPAYLPVMQPTRFEFVLNLKTAKAIGVTIPPGILAIVDEVIE